MSYHEKTSTSHHPFHPREGQPSRPMRGYEDIKKELEGKAKTESVKNKKNSVAKKMHKSPVHIKLGRKAHENFGYKIEDHKGQILKKGGKDF